MPLDDTEDRSLRDELIANFKSSEQSDTLMQGTEPKAAPAAKSNEPTEAAPKDNQPAKPAAIDKDPKDVKPNAAPTAKADPANPADAPRQLDPPPRWTKTQKEWFNTLDPKFQAQLLENDKNIQASFTKNSMETAQLRQKWDSVDKILAPRREAWARQGFDEVRALNMLFAYWDLSQRDPVAFLHTFAQDRRLDLASILGLTRQSAPHNGHAPGQGSDGQSQANAIPPAVAHQMDELARQNQALIQQVNHLTGTVQQRAQHEQSQMVAELSNELETFRQKTDDTGQPLYPFFEELRADMAFLMGQKKANTLDEAYKLAERLNPDVFAKVEESRDIKRRREDEQRRAEEAARAKRAGAGVSPSSIEYTPPLEKTDGDLSVRALLQKGFNEARAGNRI